MGFFDYSYSIRDRIAQDFKTTLYMLFFSAIFAGIFGFVIYLFMVWGIFKCHYYFNRKSKRPFVEEAEAKLRKALNKVEE